jgi:translation initiation factor IF-2
LDPAWPAAATPPAPGRAAEPVTGAVARPGGPTGASAAVAGARAARVRIAAPRRRDRPAGPREAAEHPGVEPGPGAWGDRPAVAGGLAAEGPWARAAGTGPPVTERAAAAAAPAGGHDRPVLSEAERDELRDELIEELCERLELAAAEMGVGLEG